MTRSTEATPSSQAGEPVVNPRKGKIVLAHGGGGQLTDELIAEVIRPRLDNPILSELDDSAVLPAEAGRLAFTTDSYVVQPLEFPGGDIGRLAVCGTVNDLAVCGADPRHISLGLILEEGLEIDLLKRVLDSAAAAAKEAGVQIVTGDTKVVGRGQADGMYINTAGLGMIRKNVKLGLDRIQPGDAVIVSGQIADHGLAVMLQREEQTGIASTLKSDVAPLNRMIGALFDRVAESVVFMRDATRGGLAGVLSDLAERSGHHLTVDEAMIPIRQETRYAAEMLGLDPLDVANEGKVVVVVRPEAAEPALEALRKDRWGTEAATIGYFECERDGLCELITEVGGRRIIQKPYGEELPRIC
ncbi:MAG: hydrogenase expression/formation protein HypE [Phycisphaerales bacterium]|nr:MAG: hydrogenase expression/formation protein HypE [Phycisphaerales bacterium]